MDIILMLRALGALATVMGLLVGGLWLYRRYGGLSALDGLVQGAARPPTRLAIVERLSLDPRRSLLLVRRDSREILLLLGPDGATVVDGAVPLTPAAPEDAAIPPAAVALELVR